MSDITFTLIHPSRQRPEMAFETAKLWAYNATHQRRIQYILSLDNDEPELKKYQDCFYHLKRYFGQSEIVMANNKNVVMAANSGATKAIGEIFILISDDFKCETGWDDYILENINPEKEEALRVNDGLQPIEKMILTLPILTKKLYHKLGFIYYPEYSGIKADDDLAEICLAMKCLKRDFSKVFQHDHWVNKKKGRDSTNDRHDNPEGWELGKQIFEKRKKTNFGI